MEILKPIDAKETLTSFEAQKQQKKQKIVKNDYQLVGKYGMPLIKKQNIDLDKIDLMSWKKTKAEDIENNHKSIHFFCHDWHFENLYANPENSIEKLSKYYALLTPDFSMYFDMPLALQIFSTFKNRWCGAFWQSQGLKVIPTINWGTKSSFEFCFDGIEQGAIVAVSTYCREEYKEEFMLGYNKMLEIIKPGAIICYGEKFKEMKGNIKQITPFNHKELMSKLGHEECVKRYFEGNLYPS